MSETTQVKTEPTIIDTHVIEAAPASDEHGAGAIYNAGAVEVSEARDH